MNKVVKILIALLVTLAVLAGGSLGVLYFGFGIDVFDRSGWNVTEEGSTQYLDYYGEPLLDWQLIDGSWYYFSPPDGTMVTGWLELEGSRYYLAETGARFSGWLTLSDGTYYLSPTSGTAATGWLSLEGERYYLDGQGRIMTGWTDVGTERYYLSEAGTVTTGWLELDEGTYFLDENGVMQTGWLDTEAGLMYLDTDTGAVVTGWLETEDGRCYLNEEGYLASGWTDTPDGRFYLNEKGIPVTGWLETEEGTYYLDENGQMTTGWLEEDGRRRYFREDGTMAVGKVIIDGTAYYFTSTGDYVVLVNRWNPVPDDYTADLVYYGSWRVDSSCYDALKRMLSDCPHYYSITSAYRSLGQQQYIWNNRLAGYKASGYSETEALYAVSRSVAVPGTSEHHLGLAVDITGANAQAWLAEHCWEYGFIVRYPEGKTDITGIIHEPWHYRYVGTELAAELEELGLCLEEYMDMLTEAAGSDAGTASDPDNCTDTTTN